MNYVISITGPEALGVLEDICEELALPLNVTLHVQPIAQSEALARVEPLLTEEEAAVVRRARNARQTPPRHASIAEYHRATALEALMGALYLSGDMARLKELMEVATENVEIR